LKPIQYIVTETDDVIVSQVGIALIGALIQRSELGTRIAKPDFEAIEAYADNEFFAHALGMNSLPSEPTLRQRIDELGRADCAGIVIDEAVDMVARHAPDLRPVHGRWIPLDIDVSPFDNSGSSKEGIGRTYHKTDGYAPIFAYVGDKGYQVDCQLREGQHHSQKGTPEFLRRAIGRAKRLLRDEQKLLVRMDSGFDDEKNLRALRLEGADWIIKRNLRGESREKWIEIGHAYGEISTPREGKQRLVGSTSLQRDGRQQRVVFEIEIRSSDSHGQKLLVPETEISTYWTSLELTPDQIIELYRQHGTSEQFHSEVKTDLDLERLPSGKFATNALILALGLFAYNALRLCGQEALRLDRDLPPTQRMPLRKKRHRRRLRNVIQDFIYMAGRVVLHARRKGLRLWSGNPWRAAWRAVYASFVTA